MRLKFDWRQEVEIGEMLENHRLEYFILNDGLLHTWNGHLGRISAAKHRVALTSNYVFAVCSAPCGAGPRMRQFVAAETDRM